MSAATAKLQITEQGARGTHLGAVDSLAPDGARLARLSLRGERCSALGLWHQVGAGDGAPTTVGTTKL